MLTRRHYADSYDSNNGQRCAYADISPLLPPPYAIIFVISDAAPHAAAATILPCRHAHVYLLHLLDTLSFSADAALSLRLIDD